MTAVMTEPSSIYGVGQSTPIDGAPPVSQVQAPNMDAATSAYSAELQKAMQPMFQNQSASLQADLAAKGIMTSGAGSKQMQDLTGQQDATLAQSMLPLIQQGFGQQYGAATTNAGANNSYLQQLSALAAQSAQSNANNSLQAAEFGAGLNNQDALANLGAQNNLQLAQLGYGNQTYNNELGSYGNLLSQGAGGFNSAMTQGGNNEFAGYVGPQQWNLGPAGAAGAAVGYGTPPGAQAPYNPYNVPPGISVGSDGNYVSDAPTDPQTGGPSGGIDVDPNPFVPG